MANRQKGEVTLTVAGQVYTLRLTIDSMAQLEDACSTPDREIFFPEILTKLSRGSAKYTRLFFWACLRQHHPMVTIAQASDLIDESDGGSLGFADTISALLQSTQPDKEDALRPQMAQTGQPGTGDHSTSRRARSA